MRKIVYLFFALCLVVACGNPNKATHPVNKDFKNSKGKKVYSQLDFKTLFYGKPEGFVKEILGEPDKTQELGAINVTWFWYNDITYLNDPEKRNFVVKIRLDAVYTEGKVTEIVFN